MSSPRRTAALDRAARALDRARAAVGGHEPGWDPWRLTEAQARYDAALQAALDGGTTAPDPAGTTAPDPAGSAGRDLPPRAYLGRGGR